MDQPLPPPTTTRAPHPRAHRHLSSGPSRSTASSRASSSRHSSLTPTHGDPTPGPSAHTYIPIFDVHAAYAVAQTEADSAASPPAGPSDASGSKRKREPDGAYVAGPEELAAIGKRARRAGSDDGLVSPVRPAHPGSILPNLTAPLASEPQPPAATTRPAPVPLALPLPLPLPAPSPPSPRSLSAPPTSPILSTTAAAAAAPRHASPPPEPEPLHTYACPICFSPPANATVTPCGHIMCGECLFTAIGAAAVRTGIASLAARCPVCRASIPGWDGRGGGVIGCSPAWSSTSER
ncbi:hypothetical protein BC834DRAFT_968660 [Gloeopeniophorella convolvens]|nr:hypothetical protein BC834DRAFT_968660 [Gloeopeniophorella convolvens]